MRVTCSKFKARQRPSTQFWKDFYLCWSHLSMQLNFANSAVSKNLILSIQIIVDEGLDSTKRVAYFRSISMTGQVGNQAETKTKMGRRNNSSSSSGEIGSSYRVFQMMWQIEFWIATCHFIPKNFHKITLPYQWCTRSWGLLNVWQKIFTNLTTKIYSITPCYTAIVVLV